MVCGRLQTWRPAGQHQVTAAAAAAQQAPAVRAARAQLAPTGACLPLEAGGFKLAASSIDLVAISTDFWDMLMSQKPSSLVLVRRIRLGSTSLLLG